MLVVLFVAVLGRCRANLLMREPYTAISLRTRLDILRLPNGSGSLPSRV